MKYFLILFLLCPLVALGSGDDIQKTNVEVTGASYNVSGARGYGLSGGDMDINDCLATHSILFGLWQGTHVNKLCEADRLNRDGRYQAAAEMKCSVRSVRKVYGARCVEAVKLSAPPPPLPPPVPSEEDDEEEWHDEQMQMQQEYDERIERIEARLNRPAPIVIDHGAERRAKSRASLAEFEKGAPEK